jgi:hypothetical protein
MGPPASGEPSSGPSPLQLLVSSVLTGAWAALRAGLENAPEDDPGRDRAEQLAAWLSESVDGPPAPAAPAVSVAGPADGEFAAAFSKVLRRFGSDERVRRQLGGRPAACAGPVSAATWRAFWLACLRLDANLAERWRRYGADAANLASAAGEPEWTELPVGADTPIRTLLPPAPTLGVAGIRVRPGAPADPALGDVSALPEAGFLVQRVLALQEVDCELCHALEGLRVSGIHPLSDPDDPAPAAEFRGEVLRRLGDTTRRGSDRLACLQALYRLDEAICSAVHQPPAHPDSWWGGLAAASRRLLRQTAAEAGRGGVPAEVRPLELLPYADLRHYTAGRNVAYRVPRDQVGMVLACLRTWMETDGQVYPGRVIWGSE